jgi:hypothetical protein
VLSFICCFRFAFFIFLSLYFYIGPIDILAKGVITREKEKERDSEYSVSAGGKGDASPSLMYKKNSEISSIRGGGGGRDDNPSHVSAPWLAPELLASRK